MVRDDGRPTAPDPRPGQAPGDEHAMEGFPTVVPPGGMAEMVAMFGHLATGESPPALPYRAAWSSADAVGDGR